MRSTRRSRRKAVPDANSDLKRYEKDARKLFVFFRRFVYNFYDLVFLRGVLHTGSAREDAGRR